MTSNGGELMKIFLSLCIIWIMAITHLSGQVLTIDQIKSEPITVTTGFSFKLHSAFLNEDRAIMIALPEDYSKNTKKYPVLYMLDAQWNFNHTAQNLNWISNPKYGIIPQMIVVGIHTGENRERDLTPTQNIENKSGGGADKLFKFIKEELIPFIDKNYRTYNYNVLGGVSLSGLFVMHAFITEPQLFNSYLALSPSMWWDNGIMLDKTKEFISKNPSLHNRIYLAMSNEGRQMGVDSLARILEKYSPKELIWKYDKYPEEIHETVNYKGLWNGIKFLFADWHYPLVDFGTKEHIFSSHDSDTLEIITHKNINLSKDLLDSYNGLYLDSYNRILSIERVDDILLLSNDHLPTLTLYSESKNRFYINDLSTQNELFLKGFSIQLEFINSDSLIVTANGKIDCTAKKIMSSKLVKLSDDILKRYEGNYSPSEQSSNFHITKEGNSLKLSEENPLAYLYPVGENKFFAFIKGSGYELEFINDGSNNITRMNVSKDGKTLVEAKKIN
jgi:predicted alpha/beta superfamily hydrolase